MEVHNGTSEKNKEVMHDLEDFSLDVEHLKQDILQKRVENATSMLGEFDVKKKLSTYEAEDWERLKVMHQGISLLLLKAKQEGIVLGTPEEVYKNIHASAPKDTTTMLILDHFSTVLNAKIANADLYDNFFGEWGEVTERVANVVAEAPKSAINPVQTFIDIIKGKEQPVGSAKLLGGMGLAVGLITMFTSKGQGWKTLGGAMAAIGGMILGGDIMDMLSGFGIDNTAKAAPSTAKDTTMDDGVTLDVELGAELPDTIETSSFLEFQEYFDRAVVHTKSGKVRRFFDIITVIKAHPKLQNRYERWSEERAKDKEKKFMYSDLSGAELRKTNEFLKKEQIVLPSNKSVYRSEVQSIANNKKYGTTYKNFGSYQYKNNIFKSPTGIVAHYTVADTMSSTIHHFNYQQGGKWKPFVHYIIDTDGAIYQLAPDGALVGGAATSGQESLERIANAGLLHVELVGMDEGRLNEKQYASMALLAKAKGKQYGFSTAKGGSFVGHGQIPGAGHHDFAGTHGGMGKLETMVASVESTATA